jgi:hypothetical protein
MGPVNKSLKHPGTWAGRKKKAEAFYLVKLIFPPGRREAGWRIECSGTVLERWNVDLDGTEYRGVGEVKENP